MVKFGTYAGGSQRRSGRTLLLLGFVLLAALGINLRPGGHAHALFASGELGRLLPGADSSPGARDLPLATTEYDREKVDRILDYDDVVNRVYTTSQGDFQVYIGYWAAGKLAPSHIAAHIPDRCWIFAGMTPRVIDDHYRLRAGNTTCTPGHWRVFAKKHAPDTHVVFWHKVGVQDHQFSTADPDLSWYRRVKGVIMDLFVSQPDQLFVRISSDVRLESFADDPTFQAVVAAIGRIEARLAARAAGNPSGDQPGR